MKQEVALPLSINIPDFHLHFLDISSQTESRILIHVKRLKSILTFTWRGYQPPDCAQTSRSQQLQIKQWEEVIGFVLHSLRTWLLTATYATPHERLFGYQRQTPTGTFLPTWLTTPRIVLMA
ncbi:hypothetical protein T4D_3448 [Trichinella pseudospiralis]|uniref:Uncharacterized protein n=1 Tax=Trichinella pseudospiralis TaxID=6337 RepID=A0A0V1G2B7_TRIPS|nr:hypothetical protein T4D_3448 [Trichinella pseudospiralis]